MHNIYNIDYHVTDRCNLKCASCGHFACLVNNDITNDRTPEDCKYNMKLLYEVTENGKYLDKITLTGGEATLNKNLPEIIEITYQYFPNKIRLWTNFINPNLWTEELINACIQYNVFITGTHYNEITFNKIINILEKHHYNINNITNIYRTYENDELKFFTSFFTVKRIKNIDDNPCLSKFNCNQLKNGKLYFCQYLGYIDYFIKEFGNKYVDILEIDKDNICIDLNKITSYNELYNIIDTYEQTSNICKHCLDRWCADNYNKYDLRLNTWKISNKSINEYIIEDENILLNNI